MNTHLRGPGLRLLGQSPTWVCLLSLVLTFGSLGVPVSFWPSPTGNWQGHILALWMPAFLLGSTFFLCFGSASDTVKSVSRRTWPVAKFRNELLPNNWVLTEALSLPLHFRTFWPSELTHMHDCSLICTTGPVHPVSCAASLTCLQSDLVFSSSFPPLRIWLAVPILSPLPAFSSPVVSFFSLLLSFQGPSSLVEISFEMFLRF